MVCLKNKTSVQFKFMVAAAAAMVMLLTQLGPIVQVQGQPLKVGEGSSGAASANMVAIINSLIEGQTPQVAQVLAGYQEYVDLHKRQSELSSHYSSPEAGEQSQAEKEYEQISAILRISSVQELNEHLFSVIQSAEEASGSLELTEQLEQLISKAIAKLKVVFDCT